MLGMQENCKRALSDVLVSSTLYSPFLFIIVFIYRLFMCRWLHLFSMMKKKYILALFYDRCEMLINMYITGETS